MEIVVLVLLTLSVNSQSDCTDSHQCINTEITESEVACSGYYSCAETTINPNEFTTSSIHCTGTSSCHLANDLTANKNINCAGYKSCSTTNSISSNIIQCSGTSSCDHQSNQDAIISADSLLYCGGEKSCYISKLSTDAVTYCEGLNSCSSATITGDTVLCDGNAACSNSNIQTITTALCAGKGSCAGAKITALQTQLYGEDSGSGAMIKSALIEAYGFRSLVDAVMDSETQSSMTIKMFAEMSGDGATIVCRSGSTCSLFCKNSACKGLKYQCLSGSTCSINPIGCTSDESVTMFKGIDCPIQTHGGTITISAEPNTAPVPDSMSDDHEYDDILNENENDNSITCNLEKECEGNIMTDDGVVIECAGLHSCNAATISSTDINCYGESACNSAMLTSATGTISCLGSDSCLSSNINGKDVICYGRKSCASAATESNDDVITINGAMQCGATESCKHSDIHNSATSISTDCTGNRACYGSNIIAKGSVLCGGHYSCVDGEIVSDKHVVCSGKGSCYHAHMETLKRVYAIGYYSAAMAHINTEWVRAYGFHSLLFATIDSKDKTEVLVHAFGHQSGYGATVICRENTKCTLTCKGSGCKNMDYVCMNDAVCVLNPIKCRNEVDIFAGIECPQMIINVSPDGLQQFMKRKEYEMEDDQVYKKYKKEVENDNAQFESLDEEIVNLNVFRKQNKRFQLFGGEAKWIGYSLTMQISAGVVIVMFIISLGLCLCYNRMKNGRYIYEQIP